jgi:uncharacterized membrane protein HdeD (DUF308 family)
MMMHKNMSDKDIARHIRSHGGKMLLLGVLVLLNAYYMAFNWANFIGLLLVLVGLKKLLFGGCCHRK